MELTSHLSIGQSVYDIKLGYEVEIVSLAKEEDGHILVNGDDPSQYEGIELTPSVLQELGFVSDDTIWELCDESGSGYFLLYLNSRGQYVWREGGHEVVLNYVHELQGLVLQTTGMKVGYMRI